jgi:hypothetical protein
MKISTYNCANAVGRTSALLGRIVFHNRMPVPRHQFWRESWTKDFRNACDTIQSETFGGLRRTFNVRSSVWCPVLVGDKLYCIHLVADETSLPFIPYIALEPRKLETMYPGEVGEKILQWIVRCEELKREILNAAETLERVLNMANTAGQLKRMVPDLMRYLPADYNSAVEQQERRSALPRYWASTPREPIYAALNTLAKAAMLEAPAVSGGKTWDAGSICHTDWAFLAPESVDLKVLREHGWQCTA